MAFKIKVDGKKTVGNIKPMHAVCGGPVGRGMDARELYKDIGIPFVRLHDVEAPYGSNQYVDIHCVFPDFDADECDPASYNFDRTDAYLKNIIDCGGQVFYRLGESIDHAKRKLFIHPPKNYKKWAVVCEHIIRHYNEGWADGFHMGIEYWEIWNEPEGKSQWSGTPGQFYELYTVTAKHLKSCFPDLQIGGYSAVGFYVETRKPGDEWFNPWFETIIPFMEGFFWYIKDKDVPLDFFSWHCYALTVDELKVASAYIRKFLDDRGYAATKSFLTEYNTVYSLNYSVCPATHEEYAAEILAGMIVSQSCSIDALYYYWLAISNMNGVYYKTLTTEIRTYPAYHSFKFFGDLYRLKGMAETVCDENRGVYALAASDGAETAVAVAVTDYEGETEINFAGCADGEIRLDSLTGKGDIVRSSALLKDGKCRFDVERNGIYYCSAKLK